MGRWHADAAQHAGSRVVVIVDADAARASALGRKLPGRAAIASGIGQAIREHGVNVVHICTPVDSHEPLATEAMHAGAHVLMEKPLTASCAGTERLFTLAEEQGVLLCPVHQFLFQPGVLAAQRELPSLGEIRHVELVACSAGADGAADTVREAVALDILPHGLALAGRFLAPELALSRWSVSHGLDGELRALTQIGDASVMIAVSMSARPTENSLTVRCTRGTIRADLFHGFATVDRGSTSRLGKITRPFAAATGVLQAASTNLIGRSLRREPAYPGLRELVRRFHRASLGLGAVPITPREAVDVARARDIIASTRSRR
ncbi:MAG: Oxidoreductase [Gemmatimonadetes bacterium]|nr:Oxidoreductase [Gemmatimonadota bacterium]